jgi:hypothetical protein
MKINNRTLDEIANGILAVSLPAGDIETNTKRGPQRTAKSIRLQRRIVEALETACDAGLDIGVSRGRREGKCDQTD